MHAQPLLNPNWPHSALLGPTLSHLALPVSEDFYFKRIEFGPNACPTPSQPYSASLCLTWRFLSVNTTLRGFN